MEQQRKGVVNESGSRGGSASDAKQYQRAEESVEIIDEDVTATDRETIDSVVKELDDITLGTNAGGMIEDFDENL